MCKCTSSWELPWRRRSRSEVFEVTEGVRSSADDSSSSSPGKRSSVIWSCMGQIHNGMTHYSKERDKKKKSKFHKLINFNCCESPYLASCLAGWQPRDRSPSLDRTPCSHTEPAAPPKEAHWPTNRDRWREIVEFLPHLSMIWRTRLALFPLFCRATAKWLKHWQNQTNRVKNPQQVIQIWGGEAGAMINSCVFYLYRFVSFVFTGSFICLERDV